ncbi:MAG: hypothetical protein ACSHWW_06475 [Nonlabens sp.]|uniref:hypothetical protein n=1 Tax=Nonlabens sp. TaxID=1888209 RepID=UPI003EF2CEA8
MDYYLDIYEWLNVARRVIEFDIIVGFLVWSWMYFSFLPLFKKKEVPRSIDLKACNTIVYIGFLYFIVHVIQLILSIKINNNWFTNELSGAYKILFFASPIFCFAVTQMYRWKHFRTYFIYRLVPVLVFTLGIEKFVLFTVMFHRDFMPPEVLMDFPWIDVVLGLGGKLLLFMGLTLFITMLQYCFNYLKNVYEKRRNTTEIT